MRWITAPAGIFASLLSSLRTFLRLGASLGGLRQKQRSHETRAGRDVASKPALLLLIILNVKSIFSKNLRGSENMVMKSHIRNRGK